MGKKKKIAKGDVFAVPLPDGTYLCGRVMLDIYAATRRRLFPADSPLPGLGKSLLVEMYDEPATTPEYTASAVLIPGAFVDDGVIGIEWPVVDHVPINPKGVSFPEAIVGFMHSSGQMAFECGEIRLPLPIYLSEQRRIGVYMTVHNTFLWPFYCLYQLGRDSEVPEAYRGKCHLCDSDLRFSEHRATIYRHLPLDPNDSYYEQQKQLGLKSERLYE
ncbi:MAG: immunity 26/phosphotriesterase HocA family protein [Planctomycetales bacterium]